MTDEGDRGGRQRRETEENFGGCIYWVGYCSKITTTSDGVTVETVVVARSTRVGVGAARAKRGKRRREMKEICVKSIVSGSLSVILWKDLALANEDNNDYGELN